ncbi:MAG: hypothetical protein KA780_04380 [Prolixibacteraceae bacterium]|jgi:hypothetical protein|nr:hypothetical protein [Prolixibacteraceae bacterium]NLX28396.1 hypothetical protein [Bacteroidales bacterium]HOY50880.1 hypothetical protein [Prolixibacteraceae bacterium]HRV87801.1 hypothetical protein [Prolixibacteraceae bacterium]
MDDIIVIVLTLALTILAAVNQNKKKRKAAETQAPEPDFWKVLFPGREEEEETPPFPARDSMVREEVVTRHEPAAAAAAGSGPSHYGGESRDPGSYEQEGGSVVRAGRLRSQRQESPQRTTAHFRKTSPGTPSKGPFSGEAREDALREGNRQGFPASAGSQITPDEEASPAAFLDDFSLRKAVIYREILDPKYF